MAVAIVTGAGSGIGAAIARELAQAGHQVVLAGRTASTLERTADQIHRAGGESLTVPTDVTKPEQVDKLIRKVLDTFGQINVLVNNAGHAPMIPTPDITPAQWREILDTNLSSAFYTTRAVWPIFRHQHESALADKRDGVANDSGVPDTGGIIINISSMSSRDPFPGLGAYACAKVGLNMLTKVTAQEGEPLGIRVLGIAPSGVETPMFRTLALPEAVPSEEILAPEDVAEVALAMVSGALRYASGEVIFVHKRV